MMQIVSVALQAKQGACQLPSGREVCLPMHWMLVCAYTFLCECF